MLVFQMLSVGAIRLFLTQVMADAIHLNPSGQCHLYWSYGAPFRKACPFFTFSLLVMGKKKFVLFCPGVFSTGN